MISSGIILPNILGIIRDYNNPLGITGGIPINQPV